MDGNGGTDRGGVDVGAVITVAFCLSIFSLRGVFDELFVRRHLNHISCGSAVEGLYR